MTHCTVKLPEWEKKTLEAFYREGFIITLEGRIKNSEIIGNSLSKKLKGLLK